MAGGLKALAKQVKKEEKQNSKSFEERFLEAIDSFLISSSTKNDLEYANRKDRRISIKPSSYYKCIRKVVYGLWGVTKKERKFPRSIRILDVGTALHEWIQEDIILQMGKDADQPLHLIPPEEMSQYGKEGIEFIKEHSAAETEVKFVDSRWTEHFPVSAMVDGAFTFLGKNVIFEFKTCKHEIFEYLIEPLIDHIKQGALYNLCLSMPVLFVYIDKNTQDFKAYLVEYNDDQRDWAASRIDKIDTYTSTGELPPKEPCDDCKYCGYKYLCDEDSKGDYDEKPKDTIQDSSDSDRFDE